MWYDVLCEAERRGLEKDVGKLGALARGARWEDLVPKSSLERYKKSYGSTACDEDTEWRIFKDVPRTHLPEDSWFPFVFSQKQDTKPKLSRLLRAGASLFGYSQGMNFVAALILSEEYDEATAFALFAYLLQDLRMKLLYGRTLAAYLGAFSVALRTHAPEIHQTLKRLDFEPQLYAVEWFSTLFSVCLPRPLALAALDLAFARVTDAPLRFAVGILTSVPIDFETFEDIAMCFKKHIRAQASHHALFAMLDVETDAFRELQRAVDTPYGRGTCVDLRPDGFAVVDLGWGRAYVRRVPVQQPTTKADPNPLRPPARPPGHRRRRLSN
ncbi:hypothetical protein CTAYLR_005156 [Chrysophaeum taylorii]|uniref:Rab-GAP TBC domain-containing protein n=1 Tax=Chrysophaeum taylorii TaxID=2483200 RepID=A0AAD7UMY4_9STRA|nr:hypothetical protein CTAYLR_005156 [Chrysophaeum taylorii]